MILQLNSCRLRPIEFKDAERIFQFFNDPEIYQSLGGFRIGMSRFDVNKWIESHSTQNANDLIWAISDLGDDTYLGHVGLYKVDYRIGSAEFGIMIGDKERWGKGIAKEILKFIIKFGFLELNLHRIELSVLANNLRALRLYESFGFVKEGVLRQYQYKNGQYIDLIIMAILRQEFKFES